MSSTSRDLRTDGVFGFPQERATVLCDSDDLRLSVWSNHEYLFAQAILWKVAEHTLGKTEDNRDIGNYSVLGIDVGADGRRTPDLDRKYSLDPWPHLPGLHYQVVKSERSTTGLMDDSGGRGCIRYVERDGRPAVRVDSFLIPMSEISSSPGDSVGLCFYGFSPDPVQRVNSVGYVPETEVYYPHVIPLSDYHVYQFTHGDEVDASEVPDDRSEKPAPPELKKPEPGETAPEIVAEEWINVDGSLDWASLRGQVVLLDFWATWCGPCLANITHLNQIHERYRDDGFQVVSLAKETRPYLEKLIEKHPIRYPIGTNTSSDEAYGVEAIPYVFLIDRTGRIRWHGYPDPPTVEEQVAGALAG